MNWRGSFNPIKSKYNYQNSRPLSPSCPKHLFLLVWLLNCCVVIEITKKIESFFMANSKLGNGLLKNSMKSLLPYTFSSSKYCLSNSREYISTENEEGFLMITSFSSPDEWGRTGPNSIKVELNSSLGSFPWPLTLITWRLELCAIRITRRWL